MFVFKRPTAFTMKLAINFVGHILQSLSTTFSRGGGYMFCTGYMGVAETRVEAGRRLRNKNNDEMNIYR